MTTWITDSQDEQSLEKLFRDFDQVHIPVFQRQYVWATNELDDLTGDLIRFRDGSGSVPFLGAFVGYERPRPPRVRGRLRAIDVVDGQQRLLTLYMFVMAIAELTIPHDLNRAIEIANDYLLLRPRIGLAETTRVIPSFKDRAQFLSLWERLYASDGFRRALQEHLRSLPAQVGDSTGPLTRQYDRIIQFIRRHLQDTPDDEPNALSELLDLITQSFTFVVLVLTDAATATSIFERLNFRGRRVGIVDLVRNEIFGRVGHDPDVAMNVYDNVWTPFETGFRGRAEHFFFPYSLIHNNKTTKSTLFRELRLIWTDMDPDNIVEHMKPYHAPFMAIDQGDQILDDGEINLRVDRLKRLRRPTTAYPFLMTVLLAYDRESVDANTVVDILELVESFLVRRAILGFEPTGLHALFKGLWQEIEKDVSIPAVTAAIRRRGTIQWPNDEDVKKAVRTRNLANARICPYLLAEYDLQLPGDDPPSVPTKEHVLPNSREEGSRWSETFTEEEHRSLKDTWANLIPLSAPLNESLQRGPYSEKRKRYATESMFATPRYVAETWSDWTPAEIEERAVVLGEWAVQRWPYS